VLILKKLTINKFTQY